MGTVIDLLHCTSQIGSPPGNRFVSCSKGSWDRGTTTVHFIDEMTTCGEAKGKRNQKWRKVCIRQAWEDMLATSKYSIVFVLIEESKNCV